MEDPVTWSALKFTKLRPTMSQCAHIKASVTLISQIHVSKCARSCGSICHSSVLSGRPNALLCPTSYSRDPGFESRPKDWLLYFMVFFSPSTKMLWWYLKICYSCFRSHPIQFVIHKHPTTQRFINYTPKEVSLNNPMINQPIDLQSYRSPPVIIFL